MPQEILARYMPLLGGRVRLRLITPDDAWLHMRLSNEPNVRRFLGPSLNQTEETARNGLIRHLSEGEASLYVIELISDRTPVGYCGFSPNRDIPEKDMLIALLPEYQDSGYGADVLGMLKDAWLGPLGHYECFATVWPENTRAVALLLAHRFVKVREYVDFFGQVHHVYRCSS